MGTKLGVYTYQAPSAKLGNANFGSSQGTMKQHSASALFGSALPDTVTFSTPRFGEFKKTVRRQGYSHNDSKDYRCFSHLFREPQPSNKLSSEFIESLPKVMNRLFPQGARVECFGMANGLELFGLSMLLHKQLGRGADLFDLHGSDIVPEMVNLAQKGIVTLDDDERRLYEKLIGPQEHPYLIPCNGQDTIPEDYQLALESGETAYRVSPEIMRPLKYNMGCEDLYDAAQNFDPKGKPLILFTSNIWNHFNDDKKRKLASNLGENLPSGSIIVLGEKDIDVHGGFKNAAKCLTDAGFRPVTPAQGESSKVGTYIYQKP